jgi:glycerophosphoryl diester phosphodiesterase
MIEEIVSLIRKYDAAKYVYFMTTNDKIIKKVMEYAPELKCCVGLDGNKNPLSMVERAIKLGAKKIQLFKPYFNQETVDKAHENGIICNVFWADDINEAKKYLDMGIDTVLTNNYNNISHIIK